MPGKHKNRKSFADPDRPKGQHLSERERVRILTLYNDAKWSQSQIARELRIACITVRLCVKGGFCTPRKSLGQKPLITRKRRRFIQRVTLNAFHRRLLYEAIAKIEGI